MQCLNAAEGQLTGALGPAACAVSEAYPDLKANQNMLSLAGRADLDREQGRLRPPGVQRRRDDLQHRSRNVPERDRRQLHRFHARPAVRNRSRPRSARRLGFRSPESAVEVTAHVRSRDGRLRVLSAPSSGTRETHRGHQGLRRDTPRLAVVTRTPQDRRARRSLIDFFQHQAVARKTHVLGWSFTSRWPSSAIVVRDRTRRWSWR